MPRQIWSAVDAYLNDKLIGHDAMLEAALEAARAAGMPQIQISPTQGKFLLLLARSIGARRILEIGTLGAYSTLWLARALPADGRLVSCEIDSRHAEVARANLRRAGFEARVEVVVGRATDTLARLAADRVEPFDLVFIDADKSGYPDYLAATLQLSRPGTLIVADNVVREGRVLDAASSDPDVRGIRRFIDLLAAEPRLAASATVLQTVGERSHDGFALARVAEPGPA